MKIEKFRKVFFLLLFFLILVFPVPAIDFSNINLSSDDRLLFKADFEGEKAFFVSKLTDMSMRQLTAFPEKMHLVENGRTILTLNRFGAVKIPTAGGLPSAIPGYPSFSSGNMPLTGRLQDIGAGASPDGRWILHVEPTSPGYGNLILIDISTGVKRIASERIELPGINFPVKWSPDSRVFVYEKGGRLFYFPIISDLSVLINESFRMIGPGKITSVLWGQRGEFYYLTENTLYHVIRPELFTRSIYGDFLSIGNVAAILPLDFDPGFDRFWVAPDSGSILINKGTKDFFFFLLGENRNASPAALPYIQIPFGAEDFNVLWPSSGPVTMTYSLRNQIMVLRFEITGNSINSLNNRTVPISPNGALSPDGTRAVFWGENGLELWDYINWQLIQKLDSEKVFFCAWISDRQLITANSHFIEEINISVPAYPRRKISLSAVDEFGFEESVRAPSRILARTGRDWFATDGVNAWTPVNHIQLQRVSLSSNRFRVFLDQQGIMIRNLQSTSTVPLVPGVINSAAAAPQMQIALCFDLYDDYTGLPQVLAALRRHNIRVTFFLNGEFIRRNPAAAAAIAEAGHETASLFYAPIDLSDARFNITRDFIAQGLARNEDEFHRATGKELSLLWHPPFFRSSSLINAAAASAGYVTVSGTIDPGDWISRDETLRLNLRQIPPAEMIEQIIEKKKNGAIIPVRLGLLPGGRSEYLFQRIDVLIDALIRSGVSIVPVSSVISR